MSNIIMKKSTYETLKKDGYTEKQSELPTRFSGWASSASTSPLTEKLLV